jgi:hypothetical protein
VGVTMRVITLMGMHVKLREVSVQLAYTVTCPHTSDFHMFGFHVAQCGADGEKTQKR